MRPPLPLGLGNGNCFFSRGSLKSLKWSCPESQSISSPVQYVADNMQGQAQQDREGSPYIVTSEDGTGSIRRTFCHVSKNSCSLGPGQPGHMAHCSTQLLDWNALRWRPSLAWHTSQTRSLQPLNEATLFSHSLEIHLLPKSEDWKSVQVSPERFISAACFFSPDLQISQKNASTF